MKPKIEMGGLFMKLKMKYIAPVVLVAFVLTALVVFRQFSNRQQETVEKDIPTTEAILDEKIYGRFNSLVSFAKDPMAVKELLDEDSSLIRVKVLGVDPVAHFMEQGDPSTGMKIEVLETVEGKPVSGEVDVYIGGGLTTIEEVIEHAEPESVAKMGLSDLGATQKQEMYIAYDSEFNYTPQVGEEYIFLVVQVDGKYFVQNRGYGIYFNGNANAKGKSEKTTDSELEQYTNVITNKTLDMN